MYSIRVSWEMEQSCQWVERWSRTVSEYTGPLGRQSAVVWFALLVSSVSIVLVVIVLLVSSVSIVIAWSFSVCQKVVPPPSLLCRLLHWTTEVSPQASAHRLQFDWWSWMTFSVWGFCSMLALTLSWQKRNVSSSEYPPSPPLPLLPCIIPLLPHSSRASPLSSPTPPVHHPSPPPSPPLLPHSSRASPLSSHKSFSFSLSLSVFCVTSRD